MLLPQIRKSRFWNETRNHLAKPNSEDEADSIISGRANSNRKLEVPAQSPRSASLSKTKEYRMDGEDNSIKDHRLSQMEFAEDKTNTQMQTDRSELNHLKRNSLLPNKNAVKRDNKEDNVENSDKPGFKSYREKFAIRIVPLRNIGPKTEPNTERVKEVKHRKSVDKQENRDLASKINQILSQADTAVEHSSTHAENDYPYGREDPQTRAMRLHRMFRRTLNATYFIGNLIAMTNHIKVHGPIRKVKYLEKEKNKKIIENRKKLLPLLPTDPFKAFWNVILVFLLSASAILTPFTVSFVDDDNNVFNVITYIFDVGFGIDIVINFLSAYNNSTSGLVTDMRKIAAHYLKSWFCIDLLLVLPIDTFFELVGAGSWTSAGRVKKLLRLFRFPRVYRILKVLRLFKSAKLFITNKALNMMIKKLSLNIGLIKMSQVLINLLFLNHIAACIWFLFARLSDFGPDTWVARANLIDANTITQYIASYYWAFQTLTTVGYGDINAATVGERALAILWMIVGVCLYSFAIANLSTILENMDRRTAFLRNKITAFNNFSAKVKLPEFLRQKVQRFFELNHKENFYYWIDPQGLVEEIPYNLRQSLLLYTYYPMIKNIKLLQMDANFTASIVTELKLLKLKKSEILYREEDPSQEVYFISKGSVKFVMEDGRGIFSLVEGTYFGEIEIFEDTKRISFCQALEPTLLLVCPRTMFLKSLKKFEAVEAFLRRSAAIRKEKFDNKIKELTYVQKEDSILNVSTPKKLLKSTDYFYALVNDSNKRRKRFSNLSANQDPLLDETFAKRGSDWTPKASARTKGTGFDTWRNLGEKSLNSINELSEKDPVNASVSVKHRKGSDELNMAIDKSGKSKSAKNIYTSKSLFGQQDRSLLQPYVSQRLMSIIQEKKMKDNESSIEHHSNSTILTPFDSYVKNKKASVREENRQEKAEQIDIGMSAKENEEFAEKRKLISLVDKNFAIMAEHKGEIDNLYTDFEKRKDVVVRSFDLIAQRQKELDEIVQKLFDIGN